MHNASTGSNTFFKRPDCGMFSPMSEDNRTQKIQNQPYEGKFKKYELRSFLIWVYLSSLTNHAMGLGPFLLQIFTYHTHQT